MELNIIIFFLAIKTSLFVLSGRKQKNIKECYKKEMIQMSNLQLLEKKSPRITINIHGDLSY